MEPSEMPYRRPPLAELRVRLTPLQFEVTQRGATEPPFHNPYWDHHEPGLYVDVATGEPLFASGDKFESGTGWPSFTRPVSPEAVVEQVDERQGMVRTEVLSHSGRSHLGHVFADGPPPEGLRYCINSAALRFVPLPRLEAEGYGAWTGRVTENAAWAEPAQPNLCTAPRPGEAARCAATLETAVLAGGCFWGMEELLRKIPGVLETEVGYTGGTTTAPTYGDVASGRTRHAEAVRIVFDPAQLSYRDLLEKWFFRMHDPTTMNQQGNDIGSQYRSAIFVGSPEQRRIAEEVRRSIDGTGKWKRPVVTEIVPAGPFFRGEEHHQRYLARNPDGYSCHYLRE